METNTGDSDSSRRHYQLGIVMVLVGATLFSSKAIVIKLAYGYDIDAANLLAWRMLLAIPFYLGVGLWLHRYGNLAPLTGRQWLALIFFGPFGYYGAAILDMWGLEYITAAFERLILYIYPTLVLLMSRVVYGRRIQKAEIIAVVLSYAGLGIVFVQDVRLYDQDALIGGALVFAAAVAFAIFILASGRLIPVMGASRFTCYAMSISALGIWLHLGIAGGPAPLRGGWELFGLIALLSFGCTTLPSFLINMGTARIGAERMAVVGMAGPLSTIVLGHVILNEAFTWVHGVGTALVLTGVIGLSLTRRQRQRTGEAPIRPVEEKSA